MSELTLVWIAIWVLGGVAGWALRFSSFWHDEDASDWLMMLLCAVLGPWTLLLAARAVRKGRRK